MSTTDPNAPQPLTPLDLAVAQPLLGIAERGRGFVLGLEREVKDGERKLVVELRQPKADHDEWLPPADLRGHSVQDTDSFVRYALKYGDAVKSLVFVHEGAAVLILDETIARGDREMVSMPLGRSIDWQDWAQAQVKKLTHPQLYRFLLEHERNLMDPALLVAVSRIKATAEVSHESDLADQGETMGITFKTAKGEELAKFPKAFNIALPVLEQDDTDESETQKQSVVEVRLIVNMPTTPTEKITFELKAPTWRYVERSRLLAEAKTIAAQLAGFTVVGGKQIYREVVLPEPPEPFGPGRTPLR